jgi:regulator of sirC expression with transglutaminase-like and TPR domain
MISRATCPAAAWVGGLALTLAGAEPVSSPVELPVELAVEDLVTRVRGSVVTIRFTGRGAADSGLGTGFFISPDGLVATNLHVIGENRPVEVELADTSRHAVTAVHASDRTADLAILRLDPARLPADLVPLPLAPAGTLVDGQEVVAIGNPLGLERSVVTGRVSGIRDRDGISMIQVALPVEPGNSGGPLLDRAGRVHGIVSIKSLVTPNLGFAVTADRLGRLLDRPNPVTMDRWLTIGTLDPARWTIVGGGSWRQRAGRIIAAGLGGGFGGRTQCLAAGPPPEIPYDLGVWVRLDDESGAAGLVFDADGGDRHVGFYPSAGRLRLTRFDGPDVLSWTILEERSSPAYRPGEWNHLRVHREAGRVACFVNDEPVFAAAAAARPGGRVGLAKFRDTQAEFRGFAVAGALPPVAPPPDVRARVATAVESLPLAGPPAEETIVAVLPDGDAAQTALTAAAGDLERRAAQVRALAVRVHERRTIAALAEAAAGDEAAIDLFHAALLIARLDNPDLDVAAYDEEITRLARDVEARLPEAADEAARLETLNHVLFGELGFHGSRSDYYNRANSYVNEVLDDREGIPITLSVVYMEVARRLGLDVKGIGFPGHFLVRHDPAAGGPQWLDVFEGGVVLTRGDLVRRLYDGADAGKNAADAAVPDELAARLLDERAVAVAGPRAILVRMLGNLVGIAEREDDPAGVLRYLDASLAIDPDAAGNRVRRMITARKLGRLDVALADARWLLEQAPSDVDLDRVRQLVAVLEAEQAGRSR